MVIRVVEKPPVFKAVRWDDFGDIDSFLAELHSALNDVSAVTHRVEKFTYSNGMPSTRDVISITHENATGANLLHIVMTESTGYVVVTHPGTRNSIPRFQFIPDAAFRLMYQHYDESREIAETES